jgi:hypothetical protein
MQAGFRDGQASAVAEQHLLTPFCPDEYVFAGPERPPGLSDRRA